MQVIEEVECVLVKQAGGRGGRVKRREAKVTIGCTRASGEVSRYRGRGSPGSGMEPYVVMRPKLQSKGAFDSRVIDPVRAATMKETIKDFTFLVGCPDFIMCEGWFHKKSKL